MFNYLFQIFELNFSYYQNIYLKQVLLLKTVKKQLFKIYISTCLIKKVYHKIYDTFMFNDKTSIKKRKCVFITTKLY